MTEPPLCKCHGEPTRWINDHRKRAGGYWACVVKKREAHRRYNATEKGRARHCRYNRSPMGSLNKQLLEMARVRVHY